LQQACSLALICAAGMAHAIVGASKQRTVTRLQTVRQSRSM
jgi:hypothetical protein